MASLLSTASRSYTVTALTSSSAVTTASFSSSAYSFIVRASGAGAPRFYSNCSSSYSSTAAVRRQRSSQQQQQCRFQSTEAAAATTAETTNPKIIGIVDQISQLTLLETADLVSSLKTRLNIPDLQVGGFSNSGPAPVQEEEEVAPPVQEKTLFNLKLQSFDPTSKAKVIKEVKTLLGLSLVESKKFVESAPKILKESVPKEEAQKIMDLLKGIGAVVEME